MEESKTEKQKTNKKIKVQKIFIYRYDHIVRNLLINYKFNDASYLADTFSHLIKNNKKIYDILKTYDIILPVPLHKKRKLERGYNQTELIARKLGLNYKNNCLIKVKNIKVDHFVVHGYQEKTNTYSLLLGEYKNSELKYVGKVSVNKKHEIINILQKMKKINNQFVNFDEDGVFVKPIHEVRVHFLERTKLGVLRHAVLDE